MQHFEFFCTFYAGLLVIYKRTKTTSTSESVYGRASLKANLKTD